MGERERVRCLATYFVEANPDIFGPCAERKLSDYAHVIVRHGTVFTKSDIVLTQTISNLYYIVMYEPKS